MSQHTFLPADDNEIECARCGAHFFYELTRCPNCGVSVYGEEEENDTAAPARRSGLSGWEKLKRAVRRRFGGAHAADELFQSALREKELYDDLLQKVGGDRAVVDRLIEFERGQMPGATRWTRLQNAIRRWERENS